MPKYAARWKDLGIQLNIRTYALDAIAVDKANFPNFTEWCCLAMFQKWLETTPDASLDLLQKLLMVYLH